MNDDEYDLFDLFPPNGPFLFFMFHHGMMMDYYYSCHTHKKAKKYQPTKFTNTVFGRHESFIVCSESGLTKKEISTDGGGPSCSLSLPHGEEEEQEESIRDGIAPPKTKRSD